MLSIARLVLFPLFALLSPAYVSLSLSGLQMTAWRLSPLVTDHLSSLFPKSTAIVDRWVISWDAEDPWRAKTEKRLHSICQHLCRWIANLILLNIVTISGKCETAPSFSLNKFKSQINNWLTRLGFSKALGGGQLLSKEFDQGGLTSSSYGNNIANDLVVYWFTQTPVSLFFFCSSLIG